MIICNTIDGIRKFIKERKAEGKTIGFVPTMGYLHEGHISLLKKSAEENDVSIMSIYVNPTQFGPGEDLEKYPRDIERDRELAEKNGADAVFLPSNEIMYPENYKTYVEVEELGNNLCGEKRPGHFRGVTTVVSKLFNIIDPDNAYFGQKDAQQAAIIQRMTKDLNFDITINVCPVVRESDGLALSSRNVYLSDEQRKNSAILFQSLEKAEEMIKEGERDSEVLIGKMTEMIKNTHGTQIDYIEIVDFHKLEKTYKIEGKILIALAVFFGRTRLIDNKILEVD